MLFFCWYDHRSFSVDKHHTQCHTPTDTRCDILMFSHSGVFYLCRLCNSVYSHTEAVTWPEIELTQTHQTGAKKKRGSKVSGSWDWNVLLTCAVVTSHGSIFFSGFLCVNAPCTSCSHTDVILILLRFYFEMLTLVRSSGCCFILSRLKQ